MTAESPWIGIAPMRHQLIPSYHQCLDSVAREGKYLGFEEAPPLEQSEEFVDNILSARFPMVVAFVPGPTVIGWCDIQPGRVPSRHHTGTMGLGVHKDFRRQGIGRLLADQALAAAHSLRLERVELEVYSSNEPAINLYLSLDFEEEGVKRRGRKVNGVYEDIILMVRHL